MQRLPIADGWYGFATLDGDWGSLSLSKDLIRSSIGDILVTDKPLFLVGGNYKGKLLLGGQSHAGVGTIFYTDGKWFPMGNSFGVIPCAFDQKAQFFYYVTSGATGIYRDNETGILTDFNFPFFVDGIRAVVPPENAIIPGNTTKYSPQYDLFEYIKFDEDFIVGQGATGLVCWYKGKRYLVEPGDIFFIKAQYDGFGIALACVKQTTKETILWWLNVEELVNFPIEGDVPVTPMNKKCWLGGYEFNKNPLMPRNCQMSIPDAGLIFDNIGSPRFQWITGSTVAEINNKAHESALPVVAYWDARNWPEWPILRESDYLSIQAYCKVDESPSDFQLNIQAIINSVPSSFNNISLTCQQYTSNLGLTQNIKALIPVFNDLARLNPRVTFLLIFSDQGRATGLNDHPELMPFWQEVLNGITGIPDEVPVSEQLPRDVYDVCKSVWEKFHQQEIDEHPGDNDAASRACTKKIVEQVLFSFPNQGYCWKSADPNRPPSKDSLARQLNGFWGYDLYSASGANGPKFFNDYPPPVNDIAGQHVILPPEAGLVPQNWLEVQPPVGDIAVLILDYDKVVRRSDTNGMLIRFEAESSVPVKQVELKLEEDGEPSIVISFIPENKRDGRYVRALAFKPVVNGTWTLLVRAWDINNNMAESRGTVPVTVTF